MPWVSCVWRAKRLRVCACTSARPVSAVRRTASSGLVARRVTSRPVGAATSSRRLARRAQPALQPLHAWLATYLGWFPLFTPPASGTGRSMLTTSLVLAVMILPIITSLCREVFLQTPKLHEEAALALGATRWEMVRLVVFPHARSGIVSAAMLGLGRAMGETMAVAMVLSGSDVITARLLTSTNPNTIAAVIAQNFPEAYNLKINQLIAGGLVLFVITLVVNAIARLIISRYKEFSGAN